MHKIISLAIAWVWLINGLYCKVLNGVPRHRKIVEEVLGLSNGLSITILIGISEILMAIWIISGISPRFNALVQVFLIATMNTLEYILAPDLLLFGRFNAVFAFLLIVIIVFNAFYLRTNRKTALISKSRIFTP